MRARDLLLEIGVEELPARFIPGALQQFEAKAAAELESLRLSHGAVHTYATPRRLALHVEAVAERQTDVELEERGPARKVAFDAEGRPTRAAEGFARGKGVAVEDLFFKTENGVEYCYARRAITGQPAAEVLPAALRRVIDGLEFPKAMRWAALDWRFGRPVRWLLCLWGQDVLPLEVHGYRAGRQTYGHRVLSPGPVDVPAPDQYRRALLGLHVIVDPDERKAAIVNQIEQLAAELEATIPIDPDLLEEVTQIVEYPTAFAGRFDERFLAIPQAVLITSMREHQRYFPVEDEAGRLRPFFVAVRNGGVDGLEVVQKGNEKVLRARLADADFFFAEDRKRPLATRVADLESVMFLAKLGTMADKTARIEALAQAIAARAELPPPDRDAAARAAHLCKADLTTAMVREFTELQGEMGREYARLDGEPEAVSMAIFEHYLPRGAGDELPATDPGRVVALADKLDTLAGCFTIGEIPTGSQDPYALRRAAQGVIGILATWKRGGKLGLDWLIERARAGDSAATPTSANVVVEAEGRSPALREFLTARLRGLLEERGYRYDVIDAVLGVAPSDVPDALARAAALQELVAGENLEPVVASFKRVHNLAEKAGPSDGHGYDPARLKEPAERALHEAYTALSGQAAAAIQQGRYGEYFRLIAGLRPTVDAFLDGVLVMAEDPALRQARLGLLRALDALFSRAADLTRLVIAG